LNALLLKSALIPAARENDGLANHPEKIGKPPADGPIRVAV